MVVSLSNQKVQFPGQNSFKTHTLLTWDVQNKMAKIWNIQDLTVCFVLGFGVEFGSREAWEVNFWTAKKNYSSKEYFLRYLVS